MVIKFVLSLLVAVLAYSTSAGAQQCDPNDDGKVSTSDALIVLKAAVGQSGAMDQCEVSTTSTTTTTTTTTTLPSGPKVYTRFYQNLICAFSYADFTLKWVGKNTQWTSYTDEYSPYVLMATTVFGTFRVTTPGCNAIEWSVPTLHLSETCTLNTKSWCPPDNKARYRWEVDIRGDEVPPPEQGIFLILYEEPKTDFADIYYYNKKWGEWRAN